MPDIWLLAAITSNMKFRTRQIFLIALVLATSCMTLNDDWIDLGDGYTYHQDGKWKSIRPSSIYLNTEIYSEVVDYGFNDRYIIARQNPDYKHHLIFLADNYSSRFIIHSNFLKDSTSQTFLNETTPQTRTWIKQDRALYKILKSKGVTANNSMDDKEKIQKQLDGVFKSNPFYVRLFSSTNNYWIIDKDSSKRIGPLTLDEFNRESKMRNLGLKFGQK